MTLRDFKATDPKFAALDLLIEGVERLIARAEQEAKDFDAPWIAKRDQLEAEWRAARSNVDQKHAQANAAREALLSERHALKVKLLREQVVEALPPLGVFIQFCDFAKEIVDSKLLDWRIYGEKPAVRPPPVPGFKLLAARDSAGHGATTYYGAWSEETTKLVGLLSVKAPRHPGDLTEAYGIVRSGSEWTPVKFESDWNASHKSPVKTWVRHLRAVEK